MVTGLCRARQVMTKAVPTEPSTICDQKLQKTIAEQNEQRTGFDLGLPVDRGHSNATDDFRGAAK